MMLEPSNLVAIPDALADTDAFKNSVFPDAHNWTAKRVGEVFVFTRGPPICSHDPNAISLGMSGVPQSLLPSGTSWSPGDRGQTKTGGKRDSMGILLTNWPRLEQYMQIQILLKYRHSESADT